EYEIILPMSTRAELVAAKAVEEIGINMGFDNNAVAQIKTALVEACINAFEHSKVKNGKVYCRVIAGDDRLLINITNQGKDFDPTFKHETSDVVKLVGPSNRGWGIELMKQLMDEVRFEKVHGGVKLVMTKYIKRNGENVYERKS
ncbi:MAG: ATP-binding protein, partial [Deltaproteobacteria bacterium]